MVGSWSPSKVIFIYFSIILVFIVVVLFVSVYVSFGGFRGGDFYLIDVGYFNIYNKSDSYFVSWVLVLAGPAGSNYTFYYNNLFDYNVVGRVFYEGNVVLESVLKPGSGLIGSVIISSSPVIVNVSVGPFASLEDAFAGSAYAYVSSSGLYDFDYLFYYVVFGSIVSIIFIILFLLMFRDKVWNVILFYPFLGIFSAPILVYYFSGPYNTVVGERGSTAVALYLVSGTFESSDVLSPLLVLSAVIGSLGVARFFSNDSGFEYLIGGFSGLRVLGRLVVGIVGLFVGLFTGLFIILHVNGVITASVVFGETREVILLLLYWSMLILSRLLAGLLLSAGVAALSRSPLFTVVGFSVLFSVDPVFDLQYNVGYSSSEGLRLGLDPLLPGSLGLAAIGIGVFLLSYRWFRR